MARHDVNLEFNQTICGIAASLCLLAVVVTSATTGLGNPLIAGFLAAAIGYGFAYASPKWAAIIIVIAVIVLVLAWSSLDGYSFLDKLDFVLARALEGISS
jgi:choline-glycine betaine transporter